MRVAWKVTTPEEGVLEQRARCLERDSESAARGLREGMAEIYPEAAQAAALAVQMRGDDQPDREPAERCGAPDRRWQVLA